MATLDSQARAQLQALGDFIRDQRTVAQLSLRDLAARTNVSNPYLSQIERGLHEPSVRVLKAIATALNVSAETLLTQAGLLDEVVGGGSTAAAREHVTPTTEEAIADDPLLSPDQRTAMLAVYRSYLDSNAASAPPKPRARKRA
ncbi:MAG: hypothetical protein QOE63_2037 [Acidimicrobiaceae bacterium]